VGVTWVDAFTLEDRALDRVLDRIAAAAPEILIGYASSLRHLARRAAARGRPVRLRSVETSAELLTPEARREIEEAFGCRVLDRYGCREAGVIAHECGEGPGWHVNTETVHVDTDAEGRLLVTTLMNYTMPLVRYRNEDEVETAPAGERCPCGRGLPLIRRVVGRRSDIIRSPSGRAIHGEFFTHLFYGVPGVREFQVVQTTAEDLVIRVVADEAFTAGETERLARVVREHGDPRFRIRWERLAAIPRERSGKFRFTISELGDRPS
jgi:phenylacetate-CoA ligase